MLCWWARLCRKRIAKSLPKDKIRSRAVAAELAGFCGHDGCFSGANCFWRDFRDSETFQDSGHTKFPFPLGAQLERYPFRLWLSKVKGKPDSSRTVAFQDESIEFPRRRKRPWGDFSNPFIAGVCRCRSALSCAIFSGSCRSKTSSSADSSALSSGRQLSLNNLCGCESFICRRRLARLQGEGQSPFTRCALGMSRELPIARYKA